MNILYFFTYGYSLKTWKDSGQVNRELEHFKALHKIESNIKFYIFTYGGIEDTDIINEDFITVIPIYKYKRRYKSKLLNFVNSLFINSIIKNIDISGPIIIYQNQLLGSWISFKFKKTFNAPLLVRTGYDMYEFSINEKKSFIKKNLYKYLTTYTLKIADMYTVASNCDKEFINQNFKNKNQNKIRIRPNWVRINETYNKKDLENNKTNKLVSVGRLEPQKNYDMLIRCLENTDFDLDIYGDGSLKKELETLAKDLSVNVNFKGIVNNDDLINLLKEYRFYISASLFEGNPKSVLEAMANDCLVIASDIKNHTEFLNNENSLLFKNNESDLRNLLNNLKIDDIKYNLLIDNAKQSVKNLFSIEQLVKWEIEDFNELLNSKEYR